MRTTAATLLLVTVAVAMSAGASARPSYVPPPYELCGQVLDPSIDVATGISSSEVDAVNSDIGFAYDPGTTTTTCYDWSVDPPYEGPYFENELEAAAADPAPPATPASAQPTWRNLYDWPNGHGYVGWRSSSSAPPGAYGIATNLGGNFGLWLWPAGGDYLGTYEAEWTYTAPGTTRIQRLTLAFAYRNKLLAHHCITVGLRTDSSVVTQTEWCKPVKPPDSQREVNVVFADPGANPTSKTLFFKIRMDCKDAASCVKHIPALDPLATAGFARLKLVDMTLVDDDLPNVTPSGSFWELDGNYSNGRVSYDLTVDAADAGAGITRSWVERLGAGTLFSSSAPCDPTHHTEVLDSRICPPGHSFTTMIDTNPFPEGTNRFVARASDPAANVGESDPWTVYIDRTPPGAPTNVALSGFDGSLGIATVSWDEPVDPPLPDGVAGSGVRTYEVRYAVNGGAFVSFVADETSVDVGGLASGDTLTVEVRAIDRVGNTSAAAVATFTMPAVSTPRGPVLTGRLIDGTGSGVGGEVTIHLDRESQTQLPVGSAAAGADGAFALQVSPEHAAAVAAEALANGGWVNLDVSATDGRFVFNGPVARKIGVSGWTDGDGDPAPMTITLVPDAPGVTAVPTALRSLAGAQRVEQVPQCTLLKEAIAQDNRFATIGELHTGDDQHAFFEYGQQADSHVEVGFSTDGIKWKGNGSVHVQTSLGSSNEAGIRFNARANFGRLLRSEFRYVKYRYDYFCPFVHKTWFEIRATRWLGGARLGADVTEFNHRCLTTFAQFRSPFAAGTDAFRRSNKALTFGGGASAFGVSLDIRSGFSKWVESHWFFGRRSSTYWLCGNDDNYLQAKRIFAGG